MATNELCNPVVIMDNEPNYQEQACPNHKLGISHVLNITYMCDSIEHNWNEACDLYMRLICHFFSRSLSNLPQLIHVDSQKIKRGLECQGM